MTIWWIGDVGVSVFFSGDMSSLERSSVITGWWIDSIFQTNCWHPHNNSHARAKIFNGKSRKKIPHIYWPILWCQGSFVLLRCFHLISIDTWQGQIWILVFKQYIYKLTSKAKIILKTCRHNRRWSCVRRITRYAQKSTGWSWYWWWWRCYWFQWPVITATAAARWRSWKPRKCQYYPNWWWCWQQ